VGHQGAAWLAGRTPEVATEIDRAWPAAIVHPQPWDLGELCWWLYLAGVDRPAPAPVARPFALMLAGRPPRPGPDCAPGPPAREPDGSSCPRRRRAITSPPCCAKLGEPTRPRAVTAALRLGIIPQR
jgi:hypothetical protein